MNAHVGSWNMEPDFLEQMRANRAQVAERKEAAEREVRDLTNLLRKLDEALRAFESSRTLVQSSPPLQADGEPTKARARNALTPREIGEHARQFLLQRGRPLKRGPLLRIFEAEGIPISGGDRAKVLGTILWRLKRDDGQPAFTNSADGYWPSDAPAPRR